jgi:hypothetical protein
MNKALWYLIARNFIGSMKSRIGRLKQPRYLIGMFAALLYLGLFFTPQLFGDFRRTALTRLDIVGLVVILVVLLQLILVWLLSGRGDGIGFSETEAEILLCAPLSRKQLLLYRLLRHQPTLMLTSMLVVFFFAISWQIPSPLMAIIAIYVLLNIIYAFQMFSAILYNLLRDKWWHWPLRIAVLIALVGPLFAVKPSAEIAGGLFGSVSSWMNGAVNGQGWNVLLQPYIFIGQLPFESHLSSFILRLSGSMGLVVVFFGIALWADRNFDEQEIFRASQRDNSLKALKRGRKAAKDQPMATAWFQLASDGPHWRAFAWKSLITMTRHSPRGVPFILFLFGFLGFILFIIMDRELNLWMSMAFILSSVMIVLTALGSHLLREDLRADIDNIDILKTFPVSANQLIRGEIYGIAIFMATLTLPMIALAGLFASLAGEPILPDSLIWLLVGNIVLFLPSIGMLLLVIDNGLAILFPAWLMPEKSDSESGGIEQMGRTIAIILARFISLAFALILPIAAGMLGIHLVDLLHWPLWIPLGALFFMITAIIESELLMSWWARVFDKLDPSNDL